MTETPRPLPTTPSSQDAHAPRNLENRKVGQILAAATALFLEHGYDVVTMDMVTASSGVSKSTLYVYFKSKEELFLTVLGEEMRRVNVQIWTPNHATTDVEAVLRQVAKTFFAVFMTDRAFAFKRMILGAMPRLPAAGRITLELGPAKVTEEIAAFLAQASKEGRLDVANPMLAAGQFLGMLRSDVEVKGLLSLDSQHELDIDESIESAVGMFLARHRVRG